jgi:uncharacterized phage protein (TIGR01671 family)
MREIKFRAWIRRYEILDHPSGSNEIIRDKMVPVTGLHFWYGDELTEISIDSEEVGEIQNILLADHSTSIELMQYTGLKDVDGTEIYEGDIIIVVGGECYQGSWEHKVIGKIDFKYGTFRFKEKDRKADPLFYPLEMEKVEVIGNIYENPELLR